MTLRDALEHRGQWLFRHRSHLPLLLSPLYLLALAELYYAQDERLLDPRWALICLSTAFAGLCVRIATVGYVPARTSGRNTTGQLAEALNTTGMYSIVRHPLYLGNLIINTGIALFFRTWWLVAIVLLAFALYYERIILAEEAFLREHFGREFEDWAARVPTIVPDFRLWEAPALGFSWKTVVRREYHGLVAILAAFAAFRCLGDLAIERHLVLDWMALGYAVVGTLVFLICRFLTKHTHVLRVQGR